jgi:uncharacterized phage protein (TIGR02218 family)
MGRNIPIQLQESLQRDSTTNTYLMRIDPVKSGYAPFGASLTNRDIQYDDGFGPLMYYGYVGMQPSSILQTGDLSIDNAEFQGLLPEYEFPISEADIQAGVYDYARYRLYLVDYTNLAAGHVEISSGTLGQMRTQDGLSFWEELRGLSQELKQTICARDSLTCRATFGSQPKGTGGGVVEEREYCGIDLAPLWREGVVTAVGVEAGYSFTDTDLPFGSGGPENDVYALGVVRWLTGANAGREQEVEGNSTTVVNLAFVTDFPIQVGDQYEIREGCNKRARDEVHGCKRWWGTQWTQHFRGEPDIPVGDAVKNAVPGATVGPGNGGTTDVPFETPTE